MPRQGTQERAPGARQSAFRPRPLFQAARAARASWRPYGALQKGCLRARAGTRLPGAGEVSQFEF